MAIIDVISCGAAASRENGNQCFMITENGKRLFIDYGRTVPDELYRRKIKLSPEDSIFISHAHADHIGGLEDVTICTLYDYVNKPHRWDDYLTDRFPDGTPKKYYNRNAKYRKYAPKLYTNYQLMKELWDKSLCGGMSTMEGFDATIETLFETHPVGSNETFEWEGWIFELIQQIHIVTGSVIKHSYGVMMSKEGHKTVYFTTDSQHCSPEQMETFYKKADIIIQDCELIGCDMRFREGTLVYKDNKNFVREWPSKEEDPDGLKALELQALGVSPYKHKCFVYTSRVHASYCKLAGYDSSNAQKLDEITKAKMWLSHYQDFKLFNKIDPAFDPNYDFDWDQRAKEDGFAGFLKKGQTIEV